MNKDTTQWSQFLRVSIFLWVAVAFFALAWFFQISDQNWQPSQRQINHIRQLVNDKSSELEEVLQDFLQSPDSLDFNQVIDHPDFAFFLFNDDSLIFWSDNSVLVPDSPDKRIFQEGFVALRNLYGICKRIESHRTTAVGIFKLQYRFPFENEYLKNDFLSAYSGHIEYRICDEKEGYQIYDDDGNYLFNVDATEGEGHGWFWYLSVIFYCLGFLAFLWFIYDLYRFGHKLWPSPFWLLFLLADLLIIRWLLHFFGIPSVFFETLVFRSLENSMLFMESLGQMAVSVTMILFYMIIFKKYYRLFPKSLDIKDKESNPRLFDSFTMAGWMLVLISGFFLYRFWIWLTFQITEVIEVYDILSLNLVEIMAVMMMIVTGISFLLMVFSVVQPASKVFPILRLLLMPVVAGVLVFGITRYAGLGPDLVSVLFIILIVGASISTCYTKRNRLNPVGILVILVISAIYFVYFLNYSNQQKSEQTQAGIIENLTNEHDPIAEMILQRMDRDIANDSVLAEMVRNPRIREEVIERYIINNRFGPYWNRYNINVNVCDSVNLMLIAPENIEVTCYNYWEDLRSREGERLGRSHFYYIDNFDGKIWYLGKFPVFTADSSYAYHLWISAESVLIPEGLGYPDVLIAGNHSSDTIRNYSYAKYQNCQLISRTGDYNYASSCELYPVSGEDIISFEEGGWEHWLSRIDEDSMVIISRPQIKFFDHIIGFSYLFVSFYLIWLLVSVILYLPKRMEEKGLGMKSKIQITMVSVLVFSFLLIGGGLSYFFIQQYENTSQNTIDEKTQSVLIEVQHKLEMEPVVTANWSAGDYPNLQSLLVKFSYVFNTDINIFSPDGRLVASSRPEVFRRNLIGDLMDPKAFHQMAKMRKMEYIHRENIGNLGYWSAYVPFYNIQGDLLAYLNLPYFSKQNEIKREITNFLVTMLNGYFILIFLAVVLAVLLGNQITRPLQMLQEKFSGMHLGAQNTEIQYRRNDEIGQLVKAYNQMLRELEHSAELLARSERELAWREMAKQIAHEIKNPLTPMKLSVQHLKRSWDDQVDNWDVHLDKVTKTLVEQIDSLSAIANAFSQFAKMPKAQREEIELDQRLESIVGLFKESDRHRVLFERSGPGPFTVFADKEQIVQVFNNLITNAIQSVPPSRNPRVKVSIELQDKRVLASVADNGTGISDELRDKLFQPNFTTKTSGMGLGLAISRSIVESSDGAIWFESTPDGTTFYVELPLV